MEREAIYKIKDWYDGDNRKPLILFGARQVGKTWLMKRFAEQSGHEYVYINFEDDTLLKNVFESHYDIERICQAISIDKHVQITPDTILIFDEIQEAPKGITALKYFYEKRPDIAVMAAGSLLGISMHEGESFPVGKVATLNIFPLDFMEFLSAMEEEGLTELLKNKDWTLITSLAEKYEYYLHLYYYIGGMPAVVSTYIETKDLYKVRDVQKQLLSDYSMDVSKHAPVSEVPRIRMVWNSIISQLAKENKKFVYSLLKTGARAKEYEMAIEWLCNAGLIYKVNRVKKGAVPLISYIDFNAFKLFLLDVGLLGAMGNVTAKTLLDGNRLFSELKGALSEQYTFQQMIANGVRDVFYWSAETSSGEIDFIIQQNDEIIPIEVKSEENVQSKSLRYFAIANNLHGYRFSLKPYKEQDWMINYPLYSVSLLGYGLY